MVELELGGDVVAVMCDMAGQEAYGIVRSFVTTNRYPPWRGRCSDRLLSNEVAFAASAACLAELTEDSLVVQVPGAGGVPAGRGGGGWEGAAEAAGPARAASRSACDAGVHAVGEPGGRDGTGGA
eukprot:3856455-Rhodomonas_salina.1